MGTNPKTYETLLYSDGTTSCDCPGWTRRSVRTCKHTRAVDMGTADATAQSFRAYAENIPQTKPQQVNFRAPVVAQSSKQYAIQPMGRGALRKITFET